MALSTTSIHMREESTSSATADSKHHPTFDTNWVSIRVDQAECVVFFTNVEQMAVLLKQLQFAVDEAIRRRFNDYETENIVDYTADVISIRGEAE